MVSEGQVVINGLWHAQEFLALACNNRVIRKFFDRIHRIVAADIDKSINFQLI